MKTVLTPSLQFLFSAVALLLSLITSRNASAQTAGCYIDFSFQQTGISEFQFTDLSSFDTIIPPTVYIWDFGDGASSNLPNPSHAYAAPGTYLVCLHVYNGNVGPYCCNDSVCHLVTTGKTTGIQDNNVSSFQLDLINEEEMIHVSFQLSSTLPVSIQATDLSGKIFYQQNLPMLSPGPHDLLIENAPTNGMIIIQLTVGNEVISRKWMR